MPISTDAASAAPQAGTWVRRLSVLFALVLAAGLGVAAPAQAHHLFTQVQNGFENGQPAWQYVTTNGTARRSESSLIARSGDYHAWLGASASYVIGQTGGSAYLTSQMPSQPVECAAQVWVKKHGPASSVGARVTVTGNNGVLLANKQVTVSTAGYQPVTVNNIVPPGQQVTVRVTVVVTSSVSTWGHALMVDDLTLQCIRH